MNVLLLSYFINILKYVVRLNFSKVELMAELIRWELLKFNILNNNITIFDNISKREKTYHVPNSIHAVLKKDTLYVSTLDNKVMRVSLHNGSRKILGFEDYKKLGL